jgi:DNA-nicking Smr family endonuclease
MPKKPKIEEDDLQSFYKAVEGTVPLKQKNKKIRLTPPVKKAPMRKRRASDDDEPIHLNQSLSIDTVQSEEFISYKNSAISNKTLRKLRKGQYNVEATLDLHGMTVDEAEAAVELFLQQCLQEGIRVVLIIHGKGRFSQMPVLKNKLNQWLRNIQSVLAFCSASPHHGSRGALYVLLKRSTGEVD